MVDTASHTGNTQLSERTAPPPSPPVVTNGERHPSLRVSRGSDFEPVIEERPQQNLPDPESDYDQEEFEEAHGSSGASTNDGHITDEEVLRKSSCTQNSLDSFRGSSDSVRTNRLRIISVKCYTSNPDGRPFGYLYLAKKVIGIAVELKNYVVSSTFCPRNVGNDCIFLFIGQIDPLITYTHLDSR